MDAADGENQLYHEMIVTVLREHSSRLGRTVRTSTRIERH
jgi:hypothetical protein